MLVSVLKKLCYEIFYSSLLPIHIFYQYTFFIITNTQERLNFGWKPKVLIYFTLFSLECVLLISRKTVTTIKVGRQAEHVLNLIMFLTFGKISASMFL